MEKKTDLYERDFYTWTQVQAEYLKKGQFEMVDISNLIEEVEDLGSSRLDSVESYFIVLLTHLLKRKYRPDHRSSSWAGSITNSRKRINRLLKKNPGLKSKLDEVYSNDQYGDAKDIAVSETGLDVDIFPIDIPWEREEVLSDSFWPD